MVKYEDLSDENEKNIVQPEKRYDMGTDQINALDANEDDTELT